MAGHGTGPIVANNEFDGEEYNAFNELPGWNKTGYETNYKWMAAQKLPAPGGKLVAQPNENIRIMEEIKPVAIMERPTVTISSIWDRTWWGGCM